MKINAAAYIRVSTDDQTEYSPDAQLKAIQKYASDNDMIILSEHIYTDAGISGRTAAKRPAFMQMISASRSKEKPFSVVLVHKFDRFSRSKEESVAYKAALKKDGIRVISITEHIEDDKFGVILESMLEAMAEYYSLNLSDEVRKGQAEKARRGEVQTRPCFGYNMQNGSYVINADEAQYVEYIYSAYNTGTTIKQIALRLNRLGVVTKTGRPFNDDAVRYILRNPAYKGYSHWTPGEKVRCDYLSDKTITVKGKWRPIISEELWSEVERKRTVYSQLHIKKSRPASEYAGYLSSLVKCDNCGASLVYTGKRKYLQCNNYSHAKCEISHLVSAKKVEDAIIYELDCLTNASDLSNYKINIKKIKDDNSNQLINKQIKNIEKKIDRLKAAYLNGILNIQEFKKDRQLLENEIKELKKELQSDITEAIDIEKFTKNVREVKAIFTGNYSDTEKNAALKSIIEKIVFVKSSKTLVFYYYY